MTSPRGGRPRKLGEDDIVAAVLAEGFTGITVPAVARRLGVSTVTLYRYAPTRADLLALAWDHVLENTPWPGTEAPWRELLRANATALWELLARHSGAVTELPGAAVMSARMMRLYDDLAIALTGQGFTPDDAVLAVDTVLDLAIDHRRGAEELAHVGEDSGRSIHEQLGDIWAPDPHDEPARGAVRAAMRGAIAAPPVDWFTRKLDLVLDGLATRVQHC